MPESIEMPTWEDEVAVLLGDLSSAQEDMLKLLTAKRELLVNSDLPGIEETAEQEADILRRLEECQHRRAALLDRASAQGLPSTSIRQLVARMPAEDRASVDRRVAETAARSRLLQHSSLTNWVLVQRSLIHLSNLLEIIATGGQLQPTYSRGEEMSEASGALVDHAA